MNENSSTNGHNAAMGDDLSASPLAPRPSPLSALAPRPSPLTRVLRLARKELREILRDRRTVVTLVAMPLLLYPLMSVAFQQFYLAAVVTQQPGASYHGGYLSSPEAAVFQARFDRGQKLWYKARLKPGGKIEDRVHMSPQIEWRSSEPGNTEQERAASLERLKKDLREGKLDLIIDMASAQNIAFAGGAPTKDQLVACKIYIMPNSGPGRAALAHIEAVFAAANEADLKARLNLPNVKPRITMLAVERVFLEEPEGEKLVSLAALVPLILILMTITGAVYPAIDLTAGERERGTLEILVAAPVPRFELLTAKYLSVLTVAVLTALVNLGCMAITVSLSGIGSLLFRGEGLSFVLLVNLLGLLLLFAAFFSAVLLCMTSFARSFKEAQAYLIPLMLASLAPGIMAMLPGLELTRFLAALPLVNIVLLARDLFEGGVDPVNEIIVISSTLIYALAALALAARVFGAESVLYSEQSSWADLLRRPSQRQPTATLPAMLWCLALMVPIHFGLTALMREMELSVFGAVAMSVVVTAILFGVLPASFMYLGRVDWVSGLGLRVPPPAVLGMGLLVGLLLGASLWPIELWLLAKSSVPRMLEERFGAVLESFRQARASIGWGVLAVVIVPAILEEFFFRGLLFNALRRRSGPLVTIGVTGLLFAITHVVLGGALGLERFMPSLFLGLILSTVCWASGSLWPSMVLHVCHNTILLIVGISGPGATREIPQLWLLLGGIGTWLGVLLLGALVWYSFSIPAARSER
jgi:sodium transport system permease protein